MAHARGIIILTGWLFCCASLRMSEAAIPRGDLGAVASARITVLGGDYRLDREGELGRLERDASEAARRGAEDFNNWRHDREAPLVGRPLAGLTQGELKAYFYPPAELLMPRERRGLEQMALRARRLLDSPNQREGPQLKRELRELAAALRNGRRDPVPRVDMFSVPFLAFDFLDNSIGGGRVEAANVAADPAGKKDPPESIFWTARRTIETQDTYAGFGRTSGPDWAALIWDYEGPKTSAGSNPGFEVRHGNWTARIKFREVTSEPFTARLFHALGYHADPTDHVPALRVRYHPRIFREFNLRRDVMLHFRVIGPPIVSHNLQQHFDPLDLFEAALLRDGTRLMPAEVRRRLYPHGTTAGGGEPYVDREFEDSIEQLILRPVNFQLQSGDGKSVGRWDYGELGHADLREVRGVGLLAAWLGWFDCRFDNTSLRVHAGESGTTELRACFSDLGGGLGRSDRGFGWAAEDANAFPWEFTRAPISRGPGKMRTPFRVVRFHTITSNPAFQAMTEADARWMARRIARLSRAQLTAALIASGHDAAATTLYLARLISRRDQLLKDLELAEEAGLLEPNGAARDFDFDPLVNPVPAVRRGTNLLRPPVGDQVIVRGQIMPRSNPPSANLASDE